MKRWYARAVARALGRRDQAGSVIPMVAIAMTTLITATSFTVDLGRISDKKRDMQAVADLGAADAMRVIEATSGPTFTPAAVYSSVVTAMTESAARNRFVPGPSDSLVAEVGVWSKALGFVPAPSTSIVPIPKYLSLGQVFAAVRVTAGSTVPFLFSAGSRFTSRQGLAIYQSGTSGCTGSCASGGSGVGESGFSIGSFLVGYQTAPVLSPELNLLNGLIGPLLGTGTAYSGTLAGYQGLASANITLGSLVAADPTLGSTTALLTAPTSVKKLLTAAATVLSNNGQAVAAATLNGYATALPAAPTVNLGTLINLTPGSGAAETATINAFSFLQGVAALANGNNAVNVNVTSLAGLGSVSVKIIEGMQPSNPAMGGVGAGLPAVTAKTSQIQITLHLTSNLLGSLLDLPVVITGGQAVGTLNQVNCVSPLASSSSKVGVTTSAVTVAPGALTVAGITALSTATPATANVTGITPGTPSYVTFTGTGAGAVATTGTTAPTVSFVAPTIPLPVLGLALNALIGPLVQPTVNTLLGNLNSSLTPLLAALGVSVAGADVITNGIINCP